MHCKRRLTTGQISQKSCTSFYMTVLLHVVQVGDEPYAQAVRLLPGQSAVLAGHTLAFATGGMLSPTQYRTVVRHSRA